MYHRRTPGEGARLGAKLERALEEREGATNIVETLASTLLDKGKKIGIEEGAAVAREMARLMVQQKFGPLRPASVRRLNSMSLSQLKALAQAVPDARSMDDILL